MSVPQSLFDSPIDWHDPAAWPVLKDLQGNILKGHGRDHTLNIFLQFDEERASDVRQAIRQIASHVTSALRQLNEAETFKAEHRPGGTFVHFALSAAGYRAIGLTPPAGAAFNSGLASRSDLLNDPDQSNWEEHLRTVHGLLLVAEETETLVGNAAARLIAALSGSGINILGMDAGRALRRPPASGAEKGEGIEHFGYVDGRSQPLLLKQDVDNERAKEGAFVWDPAFSPLEAALVRDPHGAFENSFGSYFVYRKLEQDVAGFKEAEDTLASTLSLVGGDAERAGAMIVGRFEDGSPLTLAKTDGAGPKNNFTYAADVDGLRCPFMAHVRKTNPRGDTVREFGVDEKAERSHLMPRRGITYGERADLPELEGPFPSFGVGLLFMAYNAEIERQFEFTQGSWANEEDFVRPGTGIDAVIGQLPPGTSTTGQRLRSEYDNAAGTPIEFSFQGFVTLKGGEYFFSPSISALSAL